MEAHKFRIKNSLKFLLKLIKISNMNYIIGSKHTCNICGHHFNSFVPWKGYVPQRVKKYNIIGSDIQNFGCWHCGAHDRLRHLILYFDKLDMWNELENKSVLHIAPEKYLPDILALKTNEYLAGDLFPDPKNKLVQKMDITNLHFTNNCFDFIICNHVLEHVPDDLKAMEELYRVLKPRGKAILQTPYSEEISDSYEDNSINDEKSRLEHFGQKDHVRIYGLDFFEKLKSVGFELNIVRHDDLFDEKESYIYGVNPRENLILVSK
jgi:SAM-dependent methyltransferase